MQVKHIFAVIFLMLFTSAAVSQNTTIRGFSDLTFSAFDGDDDHAAFAVGQVDLYFASNITDRISFLGEVVFEYDEGWIVDVERVIARYNVNDYLNLEIGKHHTPIGFWNTAYHHGSVLQPTIQRPLMFLFEDEGGVLPIHTTGLHAWGVFANRVQYNLMIGNGIGSSPTEDNDDNKSVTVSVDVEIADGINAGATTYFDKASAGIDNLQGGVLVDDMTQLMFGGNVRLFKNNIEFLGEVLTIGNSVGDVDTKTLAFYVYGGYAIGSITPYFRFDQMTFEDTELYYAPASVNQVVVGTRYDFNFLSSIRFEFRRITYDIDGVDPSNGGVMQVAFGF